MRSIRNTGGKLNFSVVIPVRGKNIQTVSMKSIFSLCPATVIFLLDEDDHDGLEYIDWVSRVYKLDSTDIFMVIVPLDEDWNFRLAYLRRFGYELSPTDIILSTDSDLVLTKDILEYVNMVGIDKKYGLVSLGYLDYPVTIQSLVRRLLAVKILNKISNKLHGAFIGACLFSKECWLETEDLEHLKTIWAGEDQHLRRAIETKYKTIHVNTNCRNLGVTEEPKRQFKLGRSYYENAGQRSVLKMLFYSIIMFRPAMFEGFLYARKTASIEALGEVQNATC